MLDAVARVLAGETRWTIVDGDALDVVAGIEVVDAIVTDPPYARTGDAASIAATQRRTRIAKEDQFFEAWIANHLREWDRVLRAGGACWFTIDRRGAVSVDTACAKLGLSEPAVGIWVRGGLGMGFVMRHVHEHFCVVYKSGFVRRATDEPDVWEHEWCPRSRQTGHPAEKPVPMMERAVRLVSSPGDLVLDPFCGSGSTGIACLRQGRRFIGIDKDAGWADLARHRIAAEVQHSTLEAVRARQQSLFNGADEPAITALGEAATETRTTMSTREVPGAPGRG